MDGIKLTCWWWWFECSTIDDDDDLSVDIAFIAQEYLFKQTLYWWQKANMTTMTCQILEKYLNNDNSSRTL